MERTGDDMSGNIGLLFLVLWPVLGGLAGFFLGKRKNSNSEDVMDIVTLVELVMIGFFAFRVLFGGTEQSLSIHYLAGLGIGLSMDGFRAVYAFLTGLAWWLTSCFSKEYLKGEHHTNRFRMFFQFTLAATVGVFLSNNVYTLFMFFEIMSFVSFPLVIQEETPEAKEAGLSYFAVAIIGGLLFLMGMVLVYAELGTLGFEEIHQIIGLFQDTTPQLFVGSLLMLLGFGAKASLVPFHTWLPKAHPVAPAPASAILSAILTKTGMMGMIFVVCDIMFPSKTFGRLVLVLGTVTMVLGGVLGLAANEIKRTLACSSMSQIGFITVGLSMCILLGENNGIAMSGAFLHMVNHTLFKIVLFCISGVVLKQVGTGDLNAIKGFGRKKPLLHAAFLLSGLGIAGVPGLNGYISKTLIHEALVAYGSPVFEWLFLFSGGLTFAYMLKLYIILFWEKGENAPKPVKLKASTWTPFFLPSLCFPVMGLVPGIVMDKLADFGRGFFHAGELEEKIAYFSIENLKGSFISIVIGVVLYLLAVLLLERRRQASGIVYRPGLPGWLDLERIIYRPVLLKVLPCIGTFVSRILDWVVDGTVIFMRRTLYRDNCVEEKPVYGGKILDACGEFLNILKRAWNQTVGKRHPIETNFVVVFAGYKKKTSLYWEMISKSVSFGLLMFAFGFVLTIAYLIYLM